MSITTSVRYFARSIAYRCGATGGGYRRNGAADPAYWDKALSGWAKPYLGGTISVDMRDSLTADFLRHYAPDCATLLDVGCAAGSLLGKLGDKVQYTGVDISQVAVNQAREKFPRASFIVSDMASFTPPADAFNAIVFNEILYFFAVAEAVAHVHRIARHLAPGGIIIVSMKNDPKGHAIFRRLVGELKYVKSVLWQEQTALTHRIIINRERPAFLLAAFHAGDVGRDETARRYRPAP